jgi:Arm DNA-binding domain
VTRQINRLSARSVATLSKPGRHADGGGLYLVVDPSGAKRWAFIFRRTGKLKEMGLGSLKAVSLAKAREIAADCRAEVAAGVNPVDARKARKKVQEGIPTFGTCADALIEAKEGAWRNAKHRYQWRHT